MGWFGGKAEVEPRPEQTWDAISLESFFDKLGTLYRENNQQAIIFSGMLFTLIVWAFTAVFLLLGVLFYVFFLWHYIPKQDSGLKGYCERKVNKRLKGIVMTKVNKAIAKEEERQRKEGLGTTTKDGENPLLGRQATLPQLMDANGDKLPVMPMLNRNDTMATLPVYTSQPTSPTGLSRQASNATSFSTSKVSTRGPPVNRSASPVPSLPAVDWNNYPPMRPPAAGSARSSGARGSQASRLVTSVHSFDIPRTASPAVYAPDAFPSMPEPIRSSNVTMDTYNGRPMPRQVAHLSGRPSLSRQPTSDDALSDYSGPPSYSSRLSPSRPAPNGSSYNPGRSVTDPAPAPSRQPFAPPQRTFTAPPPGEYHPSQRGHAAGQRSLTRLDYDYNDDVEAQRNYRGY
ncbi:hypothetical protein DL766_005028 [Monosporascus sp. MC13-8B]|uniref:Uncharacterized protein n=1 Tax=Monosporascus cannonballus TaxID=155416 RepID=A0ABY0GU34_9PEZI|nr:hypothetical protein DL762_009179 [Monosporascus cannonballus]RYO85161.1 hypothetical protein DL763_007184 [Monosporascus cannonballus]RYP30092.1 hypothetical protein DL766_005028 [Monosporascus sp. MC13-8B]